LEARLHTDPGLRHRLNELRRVRELFIQAADTNSRPSGQPATRHPLRRYAVPMAAVATLLLAVGVLLGRSFLAPTPENELLAYLPENAQTIQPAHLEVQEPHGVTRAIFHVTSANPQETRRTLDRIETLARAYANNGRALQIELVANAEGLPLVRADLSPAKDRVREIQRNHENVRFLACGKTMYRVRLSTGHDVPLLPEVRVVDSALEQIVLRLREGWTYVRV